MQTGEVLELISVILLAAMLAAMLAMLAAMLHDLFSVSLPYFTGRRPISGHLHYRPAPGELARFGDVHPVFAIQFYMMKIALVYDTEVLLWYLNHYDSSLAAIRRLMAMQRKARISSNPRLFATMLELLREPITFSRGRLMAAAEAAIPAGIQHLDEARCMRSTIMVAAATIWDVKLSDAEVDQLESFEEDFRVLGPILAGIPVLLTRHLLMPDIRQEIAALRPIFIPTIREYAADAARADSELLRRAVEVFADENDVADAVIFSLYTIASAVSPLLWNAAQHVSHEPMQAANLGPDPFRCRYMQEAILDAQDKYLTRLVVCPIPVAKRRFHGYNFRGIDEIYLCLEELDTARLAYRELLVDWTAATCITADENFAVAAMTAILHQMMPRAGN